MNTIRLVPPAASLMESIRGVGYDASTSVADLIDNSISAGAQTVWVDFHWDESDPAVSLLDDGKGMSANELDDAMTLGSPLSNASRNAASLGRFGLGLKTASLSQGRRLLVATKQSGQPISIRVWDLDVVYETNDWVVATSPKDSDLIHLRRLEAQPQGTLVLWKGLDRLVGNGDTTQVVTRLNFQRAAAEVKSHLGMIFHRYLEGAGARLQLFLNGTTKEFKVRPWDPFYTHNPATQELPEARRGGSGNGVVMQGYVLPHKDRIPAPEAELAEGPLGWLGHEGFYVYRNHRMLVSGSWLGLGVPKQWGRDEQHKLARIRLDLPSTSDSEWQIDIKKSKAKPPLHLREWLTRMAERVRGEAREVFVHRGRRGSMSAKGPSQPLWLSGAGDSPRYFINREHPAVSAFLQGDEKRGTGLLLALLEATVPVHRIWLDVSEKPEAPTPISTQLDDNRVCELATELVRSLMKNSRLTRAEAMQQLLRTEPFDRFHDLLATMGDTK